MGVASLAHFSAAWLAAANAASTPPSQRYTNYKDTNCTDVRYGQQDMPMYWVSTVGSRLCMDFASVEAGQPSMFTRLEFTCDGTSALSYNRTMGCTDATYSRSIR